LGFECKESGFGGCRSLNSETKTACSTPRTVPLTNKGKNPKD